MAKPNWGRINDVARMRGELPPDEHEMLRLRIIELETEVSKKNGEIESLQEVIKELSREEAPLKKKPGRPKKEA